MHEFMRVSYSILRLSGAESATNPLNSLPVACRRPFVVDRRSHRSHAHTHTGSAPVRCSFDSILCWKLQVSRQTDGRSRPRPPRQPPQPTRQRVETSRTGGNFIKPAAVAHLAHIVLLNSIKKRANSSRSVVREE